MRGYPPVPTIVSGEEMARLDREAQERYGLPGLVLMENAGRAVAQAALDRLARGGAERGRVVILCGPGNNGGDGYVAARYLLTAGVRVRVYGLRPPRAGSDAAVHYDILCRSGIEPTFLNADDPGDLEKLQLALGMSDLIVDALLGTGVRGPLRAPFADLIAAMNGAGPPILAVDVPSGVSADTGAIATAAVQAEETITFGLPKIGLLFYPGRAKVGRLRVVDIGFPLPLLARAEGACWITPAVAADWWPTRPGDAHKGSVGRLLIVAGSRGMTGAAVLAARAALRAGAGWVACAVPASQQPLLAAQLPEALTHPLPEHEGGLGPGAADAVLELARRCDVVAVGPGLGVSAEVQACVVHLLRSLRLPLVVDADALNALAAEEGFRSGGARRAGPWVLTPHPGEMARLLGWSSAEVQSDRIGAVRALVAKTGAHVVLKGPPSLIGTPAGTIYVNSTGNPGMAAAGMGDVLTGIIAALIGQGLPPERAAALGVYWHGLAADGLAARRGPAGFFAGDVADALPAARRRPHRGRPIFT
ncbi:MAG TPA: NAD(P)H-hydrate dehydratase [Limnochordia bacterium]